MERGDDANVAEVGAEDVVGGDAIGNVASDHGDGRTVRADQLHGDQRIVRQIADERRRQERSERRDVIEDGNEVALLEENALSGCRSTAGVISKGVAQVAMLRGVAERSETKANSRPLRLRERARKGGVDVGRRRVRRLEVDVISAYDSRKKSLATKTDLARRRKAVRQSGDDRQPQVVARSTRVLPGRERGIVAQCDRDGAPMDLHRAP